MALKIFQEVTPQGDAGLADFLQGAIVAVFGALAAYFTSLVATGLWWAPIAVWLVTTGGNWLVAHLFGPKPDAPVVEVRGAVYERAA